jgi:hypothetical protein
MLGLCVKSPRRVLPLWQLLVPVPVLVLVLVQVRALEPALGRALARRRVRLLLPPVLLPPQPQRARVPRRPPLLTSLPLVLVPVLVPTPLHLLVVPLPVQERARRPRPPRPPRPQLRPPLRVRPRPCPCLAALCGAPHVLPVPPPPGFH